MSTHFRERDNYVRITELTPELKRKIEDAVENLLMILDAYDGEADDEDDGSDEPVNGWPNQGQFSNNAMSCDDEREADYADDEPWLGRTVTGENGSPCDQDLEENGDEHEPSLGWTAEGQHGTDCFDPDREFDEADNELSGDEDEPFCGWTESLAQGFASTAHAGPQEWSYHCGFDGSGERLAQQLLRKMVTRRLN